MAADVQICPTLDPKEKCIRLNKYNRGQGDLSTELFHKHFQRHRISEDAQIEMMKAMVLTYEKPEPLFVLGCYLNGRGRDPAPYDPFRIKVHLHDGWVRITCGGTSGTDFQAWLEYRI
jgi:hypothetical protein